MNQYSETFLDHYRRPRNLGDLVDSDVVAIVHNEVCGDVLRIAIAVEPGVEGDRRRIIAMRFKAYGCAATIAVASVISEMVVGKRVVDIDAIGDDDVVAALDGLPAGRIHAVVLGRAALREAMAKLS
jgi:nitrogen fixation NifU-like protein